ncbi:MAG: G-D-S-L family lipolytic protein [Owenweeksia sp.]|nr:G-D-S-L family lipolytic protein [Owenweeksia sp.]MBF98675.1 G-D-S-L family lipolytic protein [Owenweeksia sp.]HBF19578.1 G-D-S-L family lipolytic protein [Cryomorphaceae bacterium]|tara:strand:+ start:1325 stop:1972 length:648 start_codon:yes stop_codon:yes gene_type:complete
MRLQNILTFGIALLSLTSRAQDPERLTNDIREVQEMEYTIDPSKSVVVFAGSSSIKMWKDVQEYYPDYNVLNHGFGGSEFSDLIYYYDLLIRESAPDILFIYEGDNDIAAGEDPEAITEEARQLVGMVKRDLPDTRIILISAKPSVARWEFKEQYEDLNARLKSMSDQDGVEYADVWSNMLDAEGNVYTDIFLEDNLHMNKKGYDLWNEVIAGYL